MKTLKKVSAMCVAILIIAFVFVQNTNAAVPITVPEPEYVLDPDIAKFSKFIEVPHSEENVLKSKAEARADRDIQELRNLVALNKENDKRFDKLYLINLCSILLSIIAVGVTWSKKKSQIDGE